MTPVQRRVVVWFTALVCAALTARLGVWQLARADEKKQAYALMQAQRSQAQWRNADWPCDTALDASRLPVYKPVVLQGRWLANRTVFLDNRPMDGMSGFVVVTPLLLDSDPGACRRLVLVERGWLPLNPRDRNRLPDVPMNAGKVSVVGHVVAGLSRTYQLGSEPALASSPGPVLRQNADMAFWRNWLGQAPVAGAVLQVQAETPIEQPDVMRRNWPEPGQGQDKHLAYAAQWFALSALVTGLTVWFQIILPRRARVNAPF
jgi:surfeit locus 1 family protein